MTVPVTVCRVSGDQSGLTPELRQFIDRCLVPNLVKEFLAERKNVIVSGDVPMVQSAAESG